MLHPNDDDIPVSPMKKMKILGEKQNVHVESRLVAQEPVKKSISIGFDMNTCEVEPETEPMLKADSTQSQYVIFPIQHEDIWHMYKELVGHFWNPNDSNNQIKALNLSYEEAKFMKQFTGLYASPESSGLVVENFAEEFTQLVQVTEAKFFFGHQLFIQNIHYEVYNRMFEWCTNDENERSRIYKIIEENDAVSNMRNWLKMWKCDSASFGNQLVVSACLHGVLFLTLEVVIAWLEERGKKSERNNKVNKEYLETFHKMRYDQSLMADFACLMIGKLIRKPTKEFINEAIFQAAKLELDILLHTLYVDDLIKQDTNELLRMVDAQTKSLKSKLLHALTKSGPAQKAEIENVAQKEPVKSDPNDVYMLKRHESHQKLCLDDDF